MAKKQLTSIEKAANSAVAMLAEAAAKATQAISSAALDATKLLASQASEAAKITNGKGSDDHDMIVRLDTKMDDLKSDIKELKDGTAIKIESHETRIKALEIAITKVFTYGTVGLIVLGVAQFLIGKFL